MLPKLNDDFGQLHHFLNVPCPHGPNPHLTVIKQNLIRLAGLPAKQP